MAESKIDLALRAILVLVRHELSGDRVEELQSIEHEIASAVSRRSSGDGKNQTITVMIKGDASGLKEELETVREAAEVTADALSGVNAEFERMGCVDGEMLSALKRFVTRVADDEEATPNQLMAMAEIAGLIID